ncbi:MAG: phosphatase PAP2 family protein [Erysipelotrichales bacterium]|nr:MAG: phosphatase PAP2 family protein [Erysipelotrichales bacterium]
MMRTNETKPTVDVEIPELEIHGFWRSLFDSITHVKRIYWILILFALLILVLPNLPVDFWQRIWSSSQSHRLIVGLLAILSFLALSLIWTIGQTIDVWVFMLFNMRGRRSAALDWLMLTFTQIGNFVFAMILVSAAFLLGHRTLAYELVLGSLLLGLIVLMMKFLIHRTRPYLKLENIRIVGSRASGQSFPSGHTSQAFFLATILSDYFGIGMITSALYMTAGLVGITRIYVGMHYPRDVLGGAMLGTAFGLLGMIINSRIF